MKNMPVHICPIGSHLQRGPALPKMSFVVSLWYEIVLQPQTPVFIRSHIMIEVKPDTVDRGQLLDIEKQPGRGMKYVNFVELCISHKLNQWLENDPRLSFALSVDCSYIS